MSIQIMSEFFKLKLGSANRKTVAVRLADFADDEGRGVWPSVARVAEECELSVRTVQRVLGEFVTEGILIEVRLGGRGPGASTRYDFDLERVRQRSAEIAAGKEMSPVAPKGDRVSPLNGDGSDDLVDNSGDFGDIYAENADFSGPDAGIYEIPPRLAASDVENGTISGGSQGSKGDRVSPLEGGALGCQPVIKGDNGDSLGCHGVTQTIIEPSPYPSIEKEGAREDEKEDLKNGKAETVRERVPGYQSFLSAFKKWPTYLDDSEAEALKVWNRLSGPERQAAIRLQGRYVDGVRASGRSTTCKYAVYLGKKRWEKLEPVATAAGSTGAAEATGPILAPAFGPVWAMLIHREFLFTAPRFRMAPSRFIAARIAQGGETGERERLDRQAAYGWEHVNDWQRQAANGKGRTVEGRYAALAPLMEAVPVNGPVWQAWQAEYEARGWPWFPDTGRMPVVYFPCGGPEGLDAFKAAILSFDQEQQI